MPIAGKAGHDTSPATGATPSHLPSCPPPLPLPIQTKGAGAGPQCVVTAAVALCIVLLDEDMLRRPGALGKGRGPALLPACHS